MSFADLVQLLSSTRKTGTLHVSQAESWKKIFLRDGTIVAMSSNDPTEYVSYALVALGKVSEDDMARAVLRQPQEKKLVGKILVDEGKLSAEDLHHYLCDKSYEMVARLMTWNEAAFRFEEFALPSQEFVSLDLSAEGLLMEGFRRADELNRFRETIPSDDTVIEITGAPLSEDESRQTVAMRMIQELDRPRTVRELRRMLHTSEFSLYKAVAGLLESGVLKVGQKPATGPGSEAEPQPAWLIEARKLLMAGFTQKAIEMLRRELSFDPQNADGRGLLMQAENRLVRDVTRKEVPFEAIPEPAVELAEMVGRKLSPAEAFVLSRANGGIDVAGLIDATPLPMAEALVILQKLIQGGYLRLRVE